MSVVSFLMQLQKDFCIFALHCSLFISNRPDEILCYWSCFGSAAATPASTPKLFAVNQRTACLNGMASGCPKGLAGCPPLHGEMKKEMMEHLRPAFQTNQNSAQWQTWCSAMQCHKECETAGSKCGTSAETKKSTGAPKGAVDNMVKLQAERKRTRNRQWAEALFAHFESFWWVQSSMT